jgi:hypothetical protein
MLLRDMVNYLVDVLECTRTQAVAIITAAQAEGYTYER